MEKECPCVHAPAPEERNCYTVHIDTNVLNNNLNMHCSKSHLVMNPPSKSSLSFRQTHPIILSTSQGSSCQLLNEVKTAMRGRQGHSGPGGPGQRS